MNLPDLIRDLSYVRRLLIAVNERRVNFGERVELSRDNIRDLVSVGARCLRLAAKLPEQRGLRK